MIMVQGKPNHQKPITKHNTNLMPAILEAFELTKRFAALEALRDVSFALGENEILGIAGLSGSGKSILAQIIAGLVQPSSGALRFQEQWLTWPFRPQRFGMDIIH